MAPAASILRPEFRSKRAHEVLTRGKREFVGTCLGPSARAFRAVQSRSSKAMCLQAAEFRVKRLMGWSGECAPPAGAVDAGAPAREWVFAGLAHGSPPRKLHERLHTHRTFDDEQVRLNEKAPISGTTTNATGCGPPPTGSGTCSPACCPRVNTTSGSRTWRPDGGRASVAGGPDPGGGGAAAGAGRPPGGLRPIPEHRQALGPVRLRRVRL